ncbi:hypothetical protein [Streptococcus cristatus]|uniref:hypothetical protein n=1 Tax=Streptococcus cristatus TaxID=45634 RepID=UPI000F666589|nr:hypothetical protein [Streptococcus cristatus]RSJ74302.1 hypothetical protein D8797_03055 [Streptococcus cristatus]
MDVNKNRNEWMWLDKVNIWLKLHGFLAWVLDFSVLMLFAMITAILVFQIPFLPTYLKGNYVFPLFINILVLLYYAYGSILRENSAKRVTSLKDLVNPLLYINPLALLFHYFGVKSRRNRTILLPLPALDHRYVWFPIATYLTFFLIAAIIMIASKGSKKK